MTGEVGRVRRSGLLMAALGCLAATGASAEGARFRNMMPYAEARDMLRRLGYRPYFMPGADICDAKDPRCYPELESCAKSRTWACTYTWRRGRAIIEVETRYNDPVVARSECIVNCTASTRRGRMATARLPERAPDKASDLD